MIDMENLQDSLYNSFIDNAKEWVAELEGGFLTLEKSPRNKELINDVFRIAHNIKGMSGTAGLNDICRFAHSVEDLLFLIREGRLVPDKQLISVLLKAADLMREMVESSALKEQFDFSECERWMRGMEMRFMGKEQR